MHVLRGIDRRYGFNLLRTLGLLQSAHRIVAAFEAVLLNAGCKAEGRGVEGGGAQRGGWHFFGEDARRIVEFPAAVRALSPKGYLAVEGIAFDAAAAAGRELPFLHVCSFIMTQLKKTQCCPNPAG